MMATTELQKIPETIISRSQVHEFRTISERAIAAQLRKIAEAEGLQVEDSAIALVARAADGSMRDGLTAFDQVLAFAGTTITAEDVSSVLGLVGRDLLLDIMTAVADEAGPAAFELAGRAIESGYDLRLLCRELSRLVRDLMLVSVDPKRLDDAEVVPSGERERVRELLKRFSREDLLRAFDLIARAEADLRVAAEPRYHLEMALLKWIHLRKLVPLAELIEQFRSQGGLPAAGPGRGAQAGPAGSGAAGIARRAASPPAPARPPVSAPRPAVERPAAGGVPAPGENRSAPLAGARAAVAPPPPAPSPAAAPSAEDDEGPAVEATARDQREGRVARGDATHEAGLLPHDRRPGRPDRGAGRPGDLLVRAGPQVPQGPAREGEVLAGADGGEGDRPADAGDRRADGGPRRAGGRGRGR